MAFTSCRISAPGSIMLMGEHAVLHGSRSLVCAIDRRITLTCRPLDSQRLEIRSTLGSYSEDAIKRPKDERFRFILAALEPWTPTRGHGLHLSIDSDMPHTVGLGSSAAVTACSARLFFHVSGSTPSRSELLMHTRDAILNVQGSGSGSDAAASVYGGCVLYKPAEQPTIQPVDFPHPFSLIYSGYKTPTPEVIEQVRIGAEKSSDRFQRLYQDMAQRVEDSAKAIQNQDPAAFHRTVADYQADLGRLGVSDETLDRIIRACTRRDDVASAKISGSGLGDCVVAFGSDDVRVEGFDSIPVHLEPQGVDYEQT